MKKAIVSILCAVAAVCFAAFDVVNIPAGESRAILPGVCKAVQLKASNVSPASGTVSIGEITAKWETTAVTERVNPGEEWTLVYGSTDPSEWDDGEYYYVLWEKPDTVDTNRTIELSFRPYATGPEISTFDIYRSDDEAKWFELGRIDNWRESKTITLPASWEGNEPQTQTFVWTYSAVTNITPHATTNALWTVTAAGGNAVTNFPDKTFLETPANDWVRYGTATSGTVKLFVEY